MAISFNSGSNPQYIFYNGNEVNEVLYNGTHIWPDKPIPPVGDMEVDLGYFVGSVIGSLSGSIFEHTTGGYIPADYDGKPYDYQLYGDLIPSFPTTSNHTFKYHLDRSKIYSIGGNSFPYSPGHWFEIGKELKIFINNVLRTTYVPYTSQDTNDVYAEYNSTATTAGKWRIRSGYSSETGKINEDIIMSQLTKVLFYKYSDGNCRLYLFGEED